MATRPASRPASRTRSQTQNDQARARIVRVDRRADVELWSGPGLLLLAFLVLGLEWLLRQQSGYL